MTPVTPSPAVHATLSVPPPAPHRPPASPQTKPGGLGTNPAPRRRKRIGLAQPGLRPLLCNFHPYLRDFEIDPADLPRLKPHQVYNVLPPFHQEIERLKDARWTFKLRQAIGLPNIRYVRRRPVDVLFSYGSLLATALPYVLYIENGSAPFAYNARLTEKWLANRLFEHLVSRPQCRQIVFMSEAAQRSVLSAARLKPRIRRTIARRAATLPPIAHNPGRPAPLSAQDGLIRFLLIGLFYMKGGTEVVKAFTRLHAQHPHTRLTIITKPELLSASDTAQLARHSAITIVPNLYDPPALFTRFYNTHDVFVYPTYRDSFGAVLVEALAAHLPIITTDQFATTEMAHAGRNAYVYPNHPLKDYEPTTLHMQGKYYNPRNFYADLFALQSSGQMRPIEDFLFTAMTKLTQSPALRQSFSTYSAQLYAKKYHYQKVAAGWNQVFLKACG